MNLTNASTEPVHFMVDIETLDTQPSSVILSIGACLVHRDPTKFPMSYMELSLGSQEDRTQSADTIEWWAAQGNCPKHGTTELVSALMAFRHYLESITIRPIIWCKGTDFDVAILAHAYRQAGMSPPWKYNDVRDFRTIKKMFEESIDLQIQNEQAHNALDDAIFQARQLASIDLALR